MSTPSSQSLRPADHPGPPDLSVIIVTWNVRQDVEQCIRSLLSDQVSGGLGIETIVVDNASTDGTPEELRRLPVTVIAKSKNLGYGRANNIGLRAAAGTFLLILNPDTIPMQGSLQALVEFARAHPHAGIVAPRLLFREGRTQPSAFRFPTLLMAAIDLFPLPAFVPGRFRSWLSRSRLNGRYSREEQGNAPFRIDHPLGACMLLRRKAYEQCGGFDESIFMYSEEIDLALRLTRAGWECWQVPASRVVHLGGRSTGQVPDRMFVELWRSRLHIYERNYSHLQQSTLRLMLRIAMCRDLVADAWAGRIGRHSEAASSRSRRARAVLRMLDRT